MVFYSYWLRNLETFKVIAKSEDKVKLEVMKKELLATNPSLKLRVETHKWVQDQDGITVESIATIRADECKYVKPKVGEMGSGSVS